ncbi:MAG TPA: PhoPQ-activated protein PqaA family protein [Blastocatellia bacterium]|nr:PhoPQ-activated protein PqaA family protein [Blastocatellia bacterium]
MVINKIRMPLMRYLSVLALALLVAGASYAAPRERDVRKQTALDRYVYKPDPNYGYKLGNTTKGEGYTAYVLELISQQWRTAEEADRRAIFLALLVIEILPTYLKLRTPIGQYDRKMQEREEIMTNDIDARIESERNIRVQTEEHRAASEIELNKTIISRIASIELGLAQELLDQWEEKARTQSKKNLDDVLRGDGQPLKTERAAPG